MKQNLSKASDAELIASYKETKDRQYVGILFERYKTFVFYTCVKYFHDKDRSKDALMHIFEKLIDDLLKHEIQYFKSWLHTVVKNYCLQELRSEQSQRIKQTEFKKDEEAIMENDSDFHLKSIEKEKLYNYLEDAVEQLNEEQKICITLFYLQELSYQEIMEQTRFTFKQVKSFIQNGKRNLKIYLEKKHHVRKIT